MYKKIRYARIAISLIAMAVPTWALLAGYKSVFMRMQILTALTSGVAACLLFWAIVTLVYGRIYCSTVCPLGTLTDCTSAAWRVVSRRSKSYRYSSPYRRTQFIFLTLGLLCVVSGSAFLPTLLDPYSAYARIIRNFVGTPLGLPYDAAAFTLSSLSISGITLGGIIAVTRRHGRLICNSICPVGTILGMGSRRSYFHMEIDPDACTLCGECVRVCKSECIKLPDKTVDTSRCVVCFDCTAACPNEAINYKPGRYRLDMPLMQSIGGDKAKEAPAGQSAMYKPSKNCKQ